MNWSGEEEGTNGLFLYFFPFFPFGIVILFSRLGLELELCSSTAASRVIFYECACVENNQAGSRLGSGDPKWEYLACGLNSLIGKLEFR